MASDFSDDPERAARESSAPLSGYEIVDVAVTPGSPAAGRRIGEVPWPDGAIVMAVSDGDTMVPARPETVIRVGGRVVLLASTPTAAEVRGPPMARPGQLGDELRRAVCRNETPAGPTGP